MGLHETLRQMNDLAYRATEIAKITRDPIEREIKRIALDLDELVDRAAPVVAVP